MRKSLLSAAAVAVMTGTVFSAEVTYLFPSAAIPGGKAKDQTTQFVSFIWDDNGYSGEPGTSYEPRSPQGKETSVPDSLMGYVGGMVRDWSKNDGSLKTGGKNPLNIEEGGMGLSWAVQTFGKKLNGGHMTFNMISGLFIPIWGEDLPNEQYSSWKNRRSEYGSTKDDGSEHANIAISWGREQQISSGALTVTTNPNKSEVQISYMLQGVKKMLKEGHEIGNHTVDHMETNSIWPKKLWPNGGDGFDAFGTKDILGEDWDERAEGYSDSVSSRGWMKYAGKKLEKNTWKDIIVLGETDGKKQGIANKLVGFRAPRLEINSSMFYALKEKGYTYDCGVEEGLEENRTGENFLWPYTTDNGIPNFYTQQENGEKLFVDSLPAGLWEVPVNVLIVPEGIRPAVFAAHKKIADAEKEDVGTLEEWDGKVTGFDFNMFILFGMTKDQAVQTLKHTFDLHYKGNRAPMQIGCHTDYFTPMYDNATLYNKPAYKIALDYNKWEDRKAAWEAFADYAAPQPKVKFVSGKELIDSVKAMAALATVPTGVSLSSDAVWEFTEDEVGSKNNAGDFKGSWFNGDITLNPSDTTKKLYSFSSYTTSFKPAELTGLSHISLGYNTNVPLAVRIYVEGDLIKGETGDAAWEVILNNKGLKVASGAIPLSAFSYGQYAQGEKTAIDASKIKAIEIAPLTEGSCKFAISDIKLYGASKYVTPISGMSQVQASSLRVNSLSANSLNLSVPKAGNYKVGIYTANGRMIRTVDARALTAGSNAVHLETLPAGVYMVKISGEQASYAAKAFVM